MHCKADRRERIAVMLLEEGKCNSEVIVKHDDRQNEMSEIIHPDFLDLQLVF